MRNMHLWWGWVLHSCLVVLSDTPDEYALGRVDVLCPKDVIPIFRGGGFEDASK